MKTKILNIKNLQCRSQVQQIFKSNFFLDLKNLFTLMFIISASTLLQSQTALSKETTMSKAYFAGGCFWCTESDLEKLKGVSEVISGYSGGDKPNPTYKEVSSGQTKHIESVMVKYDNSILDYKTLVQKFLLTVDVTDPDGQFVDKGPQYISAIFYETEEQKKIIDSVLKVIEEKKPFEEKIVTKVLKFKSFYDAEKYHQDYYKKSSFKYKFYRSRSGRDRKLKSLWGDFNFETELASKPTAKSTAKPAKQGKKMSSWDDFKKPSKEELQKILTEEQFKVTQKDGTERPFENEFNANKQDGIYVDIVSGEPLFSSKDKYDSGTGWPSFSKPISEKFVKTKRDFKMILPRTEVRSKFADSHLGHVFKDGPEPTGLRYCMNSASMRFIPKDKMTDEGYEEFLKYLD